MGLQQRRVDRKVRRGSRVWLHVDSPCLGVESVGRQGTLDAQILDLIDELIAAVVALAGETLGVLVRKADESETGAERNEPAAAESELPRATQQSARDAPNCKATR